MSIAGAGVEEYWSAGGLETRKKDDGFLFVYE